MLDWRREGPAGLRPSGPQSSGRRSQVDAVLFSLLLLLALVLVFVAWPYLLPASPSADSAGGLAGQRLADASPTSAGAQQPAGGSPTPMTVAMTSPDSPSTPTNPATATAHPAPKATPAPTPTRVLPQAAAPSRLLIESIGVDARVVAVGVIGEGELESPHSRELVGWFKLGPKPGEVGNAVIDGHVDWIDSIAVFYYLSRLEAGDAIVVVDAAGAEHRFLVTWKELYPVADPPLTRIFGPTEEPALTLITCGGQFDRSVRSYTHRWVVRAVAAPPRPPVGRAPQDV